MVSPPAAVLDGCPLAPLDEAVIDVAIVHLYGHNEDEDGAVERRDTPYCVFPEVLPIFSSPAPHAPNLPTRMEAKATYIRSESPSPRLLPASFMLSAGLAGRPVPAQGPRAHMYCIPNGNGNRTIRIQIGAGRMYYSGSKTHTQVILNNVRIKQGANNVKTISVGD